MDSKQLELFDKFNQPNNLLFSEVFPDTESDEVEYKSAKDGFPNSFWETYSAFGNTNGGVIVLGVKEKKNQILVEGLEDATVDKYKKEFWNAANNRQKVSVNLLRNEDVREYILEGKKVLLMSGRFHYYEGHSMETVTFPFRVFHLLGIKNLILSNASGGVNPNFKVGDIMIVKDHINMMPEHPLRGKNIDELGPRFVDMSEPYNREMIALAEEIAQDQNITVQKGVYVGLQGPTFETPAEYGLVRAIGGDAVGMSTVPEVIVAKHMGMHCFCLSIITDLGGPEIAFAVSHEEVLQAANVAMPHVIKLVKGLVARWE